MKGPAHATSSGTTLIRAFGLWDVVAMNIVAVVGLRWIARGARTGPPSITLWVLAWLLFFVPLAAAVAELSSRYPDQGGLYAWTRRAFGPAHGFICGWCLWVNNLFYFPSLLLFAAANALLLFGSRFAWLAESRGYSVAFVLAALWLCIGLNVLGLNAGKWLQNLGTVATWLPALLLIGSGAVACWSFGSATSFTAANLVPRDDFWTTVSLWSAMCFAFAGFEIASFVGQEVKNPTRTIPLGVVIAGVVTTLIYIGGSAAVLVAVPQDALVERSGIADAVELVSSRVGLAGLGALTGALLALGSLAGTNSWVAGAARVPFAAGVDRALPAAFARLHARYRTPYAALGIQGAVASVIFLTSVFLSVSGGRTTIQEAYDILVNLTILIYFVPYLYLFLALVRLRTRVPMEPADPLARQPAPVFIPGGGVGLGLVSGAGFLATAISLALVFVPPAGTTNVLNYEGNLIGQAAVILVLGGGLYWHSRRRATRAATIEDP
jgi:glutamate:GABA antiporter